MKSKIISFIAAGIICAGCTFTQDIDTSRIELPALSEEDYIVEYEGYTSSYDMFTKTPEWVAYELTKDETYGDAAERGNSSARTSEYFCLSRMITIIAARDGQEDILLLLRISDGVMTPCGTPSISQTAVRRTRI